MLHVKFNQHCERDTLPPLQDSEQILRHQRSSPWFSAKICEMSASGTILEIRKELSGADTKNEIEGGYQEKDCCS